MSPKVLSIFNNAKIFLSEEEMKELQLCINTELGQPKVATKKATKKSKELQAWTIESVTERLLATYFKKK